MVAARVREILAHEKITADDDAIAIVVREAAGSLRDALTVLDQLLAFGGDGLKGEEVARGLGIADQRSVIALAEALLAGDAAQCLKALAALGQQGLDILHLARQLLSLTRDLVVLRIAGDDAELVDRAEEERQRYARIAEAHSAQHLERTFAGLSKLVDEAGQSANPQLALEMGLVRLADRPPLEPLTELLARLQALEQRLGGGGGAGPSAGRDPSGGGGARNPRRPSQQVQAPHELRTTGRLDVRPRRGAADAREADAPPPQALPAARPAQPAQRDAGTPGVARAKPAGDAGGEGVPQAWRDIVGALHEAQPALGAVLEHGVPVEVSPALLVLSFPEGSFFGRQATSEPARQALAEAAERVLGQRPRIEVGFGLESKRPTVAAQEATKRKERRDEVTQAALNHPRVKDALDVFPEAEGQVDVQVED